MNSLPADESGFREVKLALSTALAHVNRLVDESERARDRAERELRDALEKRSDLRMEVEELGFDPDELAGDERLAATRPVLDPVPAHTGFSDEPRAHYDEDLVDLISDGRVSAGERLRCTHHGREFFAVIEADGSISGHGIGQKPSLSAAARAVVGGSHRNGWRFWHVDRDGRWVPLADLRKR